MDDVMYRSNNQFTRTQANEAKLGYYPTPERLCHELGQIFSYTGPQRVLEPSCGEGNAVIAFLDSCEEPVELFGVELHEERARAAKEKSNFKHVLEADFLSGTFISNGVFSLVFANPPYGDAPNIESEALRRQAANRLERKFLDKAKRYLAKDGILVWIIPHRIFIEDSYMGAFLHSFEVLNVFKFPDGEFERFGQVAIVARKRREGKGITGEYRKEQQERFKLENIRWVTTEDAKSIEVLPAPDAKIEFRKAVFDLEAMLEYEQAHPEDDVAILKAVDSAINKVTKVRTTYRPIRKVSKQNLALLAACGVGSGYAGKETENTLHLQRGSVERIVSTTVELDPKSGKQIATERVQSSTQISLVEQSGEVTYLVKHDGEDAPKEE